MNIGKPKITIIRILWFSSCSNNFAKSYLEYNYKTKVIDKTPFPNCLEFPTVSLKIYYIYLYINYNS